VLFIEVGGVSPGDQVAAGGKTTVPHGRNNPGQARQTKLEGRGRRWEEKKAILRTGCGGDYGRRARRSKQGMCEGIDERKGETGRDEGYWGKVK
jgi:hypothetical protein